jgi:hypothetical protein
MKVVFGTLFVYFAPRSNHCAISRSADGTSFFWLCRFCVVELCQLKTCGLLHTIHNGITINDNLLAPQFVFATVAKYISTAYFALRCYT